MQRGAPVGQHLGALREVELERIELHLEGGVEFPLPVVLNLRRARSCEPACQIDRVFAGSLIVEASCRRQYVAEDGVWTGVGQGAMPADPEAVETELEEELC